MTIKQRTPEELEAGMKRMEAEHEAAKASKGVQQEWDPKIWWKAPDGVYHSIADIQAKKERAKK